MNNFISIAFFSIILLHAPGCMSTSSTSTSSVSVNNVESSVQYGTRKKLNEYADWTVSISVDVSATGPAFGYYNSSLLSIYGDLFAEDSDTWLNFNSDGWPEEYKVRAVYQSWPDELGEVIVTVTVDDVGSSNFGDVVYRANHQISWEASSTP